MVKVVRKKSQYTKGKVLNEFDSTPVSYCLLKIKGTQEGTVCDENGNYELSINVGDTLLLSSSGYEKREINFDGSNSDFNLKPSEITLNELMIYADGDFAKHVINKVIENLKRNYDLSYHQRDYYKHQKITRNNKLKLDIEYFGKLYYSYDHAYYECIDSQIRYNSYFPFNSSHFTVESTKLNLSNPTVSVSFNKSIFNGIFNKYKITLMNNEEYYEIKVEPKKRINPFFTDYTIYTISTYDYAILKEINYRVFDAKKQSLIAKSTYKENGELYPLKYNSSEIVMTTFYNKSFEDTYEVVYSKKICSYKGYNLIEKIDEEIIDERVWIPLNIKKQVLSDDFYLNRNKAVYIKNLNENKNFWDNFKIPNQPTQDQGRFSYGKSKYFGL
ncbi:carboxypeptidase-like regulatory domain-containing protein (plasmid) [Flammeovirga pectinis]|uniref:Carboxypeptidase-like regulatory domain-containing protein n=1 Tax=Flammeovirga pectinis TaxID=2494373 RepID=A0A3S9PBX9_9BACT|nr:carboxypeptidase-like regulatory domain-containing protein [Flammeovirga pectinis]AZQ65649.1 carboxypeptidase-like regulatory domain-containing protein [Flammeovirga pectinis]